jgi:hypothetical protein
MDGKLYVSKNGKDLCISCECETKYSHDTSIEYRDYYIEGAGQLCKECYDKIVNQLEKIRTNLD